MLQNKIVLNNEIRKFIIDNRKNAKEQNPLLTADYISKKIGRAKSWLSQVENGRLKSVKKNDLINVFCIIKNIDKDDKISRKNIEEYLDDRIQLILITQEHGITDEKGNILDYTEFLSFQEARGHIKFAGRNLTNHFYELLDMSIDKIENNLQELIRYTLFDVIEWITRALTDTAKLFSDELSVRNLYLLIKTSIKIYEDYYEYYGLTPLKIQSTELQELKEKLNTDYFIREKTIRKSLDEYSSLELDNVITHFSSEEYMTWKNKHVYVGDDPFPMLVNFVDSSTFKNNFVSYEDITKATGLSEEKYLYIIKQIYDQFDVLYKRCKTSLQDYEDLEIQNAALFRENEQLKKDIMKLKENTNK